MGKSKHKKSKNSTSKGAFLNQTSKKRAPVSSLPSAPSFLKQHTKKAPSVPLPLPFPSGLPFPANSFLRNEPPYEKSFQVALDTSFEGFAVDSPAETSSVGEEAVQNALLELENLGFFRPDVTQPFGLGTKCAKTYVTRCLLGEQGTTYKYLGLRMFSHPWDENEAVGVIKQLNDALTERTVHHLSVLDKKRSKRGGSTKGRPGFDICLVNRMEHSADLKPEPSLGEASCAVSWHADSSLEHFSTIAVYQTIAEKDDSGKDGWSVALRVAHHAEGPESSRRGTNIEGCLAAETPTLSISLPSGAAYYLLDDFNHHHQHAVVSQGDSQCIRFSCTHRLLRQSHNVNDILDRCKRVCASFHKKGVKVWRPEQLLLTEIESEWIRQFYIQGQQHHDLLWEHWGDSMERLLQYWSQLETRTKQVIDFLQAAAEGRCAIDRCDGPTPTNAERKKRSKRKKAFETLEELISRTKTTEAAAIQSIYDSMADGIGQRAEMRRLWKKREQDHVFRELDHSQRPLPIPFEFEVETKGNSSAASPMPENLLSLADGLIALGRACVSGDPQHLLVDYNIDRRDQKQGAATNAETDSPVNEHCQSHSWYGWNTLMFGLEMQAPWASLLLQRKKTVETRAYDLPPALIGNRIEIFQSRQGSTVSALGNRVPLTGKDSALVHVGWCTFTRVIKYHDAGSFDADRDAHLVANDSSFYPFGKETESRIVYGWVVGDVGTAVAASSDAKVKAIVRRYRSLFELQHGDSKVLKSAPSAKKRPKKRRRY